jgi:hypothetical protein
MTKTKTNLTLLLLSVVLIIVVTGTSITPDKSFLSELKERLIQYNAEYHIERFYLMTDRYAYRPGEDLWFRGFVVSSDKQQQSAFSQDFYIKLLNSKGEEIVYRRYPLINNQSSGRVIIPRTSIPGKYWLVAYTGWMKNRCFREVFRKEILISKYFEKRFLVEAIYNKVVFYPQDSLSANIRILDPAGDPIPEISFNYTIESINKQFLKGDGRTDNNGFSTINSIIPGSEEILMMTIEIRSRRLSGEFTLILPAITTCPEIEFFPEGGNLVKGMRNLMAFKAFNSIGQPAVIAGAITDQNGDVIQLVSTNFTGKGAFEYLPTEDTCYLKITRPKGISKRFPLPMANKGGFIIRLAESDIDSAKFSITSSDDRITSVSHWIAVLDRQVVWSDDVSFIKSARVNIPLKNLNSGILQVSVFDQNHDMIAERLIRIKHQSGQLSVKTDHQFYHNRQRVNIMIEYPGNLNSADIALSVSLRNLAHNSQMTDFKSVINSIACDTNSQYTPDLDLAEDLDLLTTNYRNVNWYDVLAVKGINKPYLRYDGLSGNVYDKKDNLSQHAKVRVTNIPIYRTYETQSDEHGAFQVLFGSDIIDYNYLNIDAYDALGKVNLTAKVDHSFSDEIKNTLIEENENNEQQKTEDVLSYGEPDLVYVLRYGPGKFRKSIKETRKKYDPNQYANYTNVLDIIKDIKPYRQIDNKFFFTSDSANSLISANTKGAIIVINGIPKGDNASVLKNMLPSDITNINISTSLLDVHKYTTLNLNGVIEITTIQGMYRYRQPSFQFGLDISNADREFYSPDYAVETKIPVDNRKTLYWNPKLLLSPGMSIFVTFYTSDIKGIFYGQIVGVDNVGNPIESSFTFKVE